MLSIEDKITGMFLGVAIGDALGLPVEAFSYERIQKEIGRVTDYLDITNHKYIDDYPAGTVSDDTQLTLATANGIINSTIKAENPLCIKSQVETHVKAYHASTMGWGRSTKDSLRNLANGALPDKSGNPGGVGNGIAMKISPVGALMIRDVWTESTPLMNNIETYARMTHQSALAVQSGWCHANAVAMCLINDSESFSIPTFLGKMQEAASESKKLHDYDPEQDLSVPFDKIAERLYRHKPAKEIADEFGKGSCYVLNSLPFSYAFFVRNPHSIETLYDVASAGGDTDSNASIVGGMLGALHGPNFFPERLIDGLLCKDDVLDTAKNFCEKLGI